MRLWSVSKTTFSCGFLGVFSPDFGDSYTPVIVDTVGATPMGVNPATYPTSRNIDVRHHSLHELVEEGELNMSHAESPIFFSLNTTPLSESSPGRCCSCWIN